MQIQLLIENFGIYSLLLVAITYTLMIPLNILYKNIMKVEKLERLRKLLSAMSVYLVAMLVVDIFTMIFSNDKISFLYVFASSIPVGFLSQVLWSLTKFVKDYGWMPLVAKIAQSNEFKNALKKLGVDKRLISLLSDNVRNVDVKTLDEFIKDEVRYSAEIRSKLAGFVESEKMQPIINMCLAEIKKNLPKKQNNVSIAKEVK